MCKSFMAVFLSLLAGASCWASNASSEELGKQADFRKAYGNIDKAERVKAVELLEGFAHPSTLQMLSTVVNTDRDEDVKKAAFHTLAKAPAHDPSVAQLLVNLFNQVKPNDVPLRIEYAKLMEPTAFKYPVAECLADWGSKQRYPDRFSGTLQSGYNVDPNIAIDKQRKEFVTFIEVFNALTQAGLKATDRNSPSELRKWWDANRIKVAQIDKELLAKFQAEDEAKRDNNNPLVPKTRKDEPEKKDKKDDPEPKKADKK
jgi:hypothetical protein